MTILIIISQTPTQNECATFLDNIPPIQNTPLLKAGISKTNFNNQNSEIAKLISWLSISNDSTKAVGKDTKNRSLEALQRNFSTYNPVLSAKKMLTKLYYVMEFKILQKVLRDT